MRIKLKNYRATQLMKILDANNNNYTFIVKYKHPYKLKYKGRFIMHTWSSDLLEGYLSRLWVYKLWNLIPRRFRKNKWPPTVGWTFIKNLKIVDYKDNC